MRYPTEEEAAAAYRREAERHCEDGEVLLMADRRAGALASLHKASELALKSWLIRKGLYRFLDALPKSHTPLATIGGSPHAKHLLQDLNGQDGNMVSILRVLESYESRTPSTLHPRDEENAEYPFPVRDGDQVRYVSPVEMTRDRDIQRYADAVRRLFAVLDSLA